MKRGTTLALAAALVIQPLTAQETGDVLLESAQQAMGALSEGRAGDAVAILEAVSDRPDFGPPLQGALGAALVEDGQFERALEVLGPLLDEPADPAALYNAGRAAFGLGMTEQAKEYLGRSVALSPLSPAARRLGLILGAEGNFTDAYVLLKPWAEQDPYDLEAGLAAAYCAVQLERTPEAEELLGALPQDHPRVPYLWGRVLLQQGDPWGALATLKPALSSDTGDHGVEIRLVTAQAYRMVGEAAQGVAILRDLPPEPRVALELGRSLYQSGDVKGAIEVMQPFAAEIAANPDLGGQLRGAIALEYGRLLLNDGQHADSIPFLVIATEEDAENKQAWQALGQSLAATSQAQEAEQALARFQEIVASEPPIAAQDQQAETHNRDPTGRELRKAINLLARGLPMSALEIAIREARLAPADPRPRLVASQALLTSERVDQALGAAEEALVLAPGLADGYYQRGVVRMAMQDVSSAESDFRQALEASPNHVATMNDLAVLMLMTDRPGEARSLLERVLELNPQDELAQRNLAGLPDSG